MLRLLVRKAVAFFVLGGEEEIWLDPSRGPWIHPLDSGVFVGGKNGTTPEFHGFLVVHYITGYSGNSKILYFHPENWGR